jgi:hypothetical protein
MNLETKLDDYSTHVLDVMSNTSLPDALNKARKAAEAFCKVIILYKHGDSAGQDIIEGRVNFKGTAPKFPTRPDLNDLVNIVTYETDEVYKIIKPKTRRHQIKNFLDAIRTQTNPSSHDANNPEDYGNESSLNYVKLAIAHLTQWLFVEHLSKSLPDSLKPCIHPLLNIKQETEPTQELRGLDIIKLQFPNHNVTLFRAHNDSVNSIGYELITVEVVSGVILAYLFLKGNIVIEKTLNHFLENTNLILASLSIISPKIYNKTSGNEVDRLSSIKRAVSNLNNSNLLRIVEYHYVNDFLWDKCLNPRLGAITKDITPELYFLDQELFSEEETEPKPSLGYIKQIIESGERAKPVSLIIGPGGVGKTTFCEQAVSLINKEQKKRAILISSSDIKDINTQTEVKSVADLYRLYMSVESDSASILESNNLEINISCGNLVLIIDGLDEIDASLKGGFYLDSFLNSVIELNKSYQNCTIIITSRDYFSDRYSNKEYINTFKLRGFNNDLVEKYLEKRLSPSQIKEAKNYLNDIELSDQGRQVPLYLHLVCEMIGREAELNTDLVGSRYFCSEIKLDKLIFDLIQREIKKQSLEMFSCDEYFDLLVEIAVEHKGLISKNDLDYYIETFTQPVTSLGDKPGEYNQFYVSPLLTHDPSNETFKIKHDLVETWVKARFLFSRICDGQFSDKIERLLAELYNGTSPLFNELKRIKLSSSVPTKKGCREILNQLIKIRNPTIVTRRAISGLLYFALLGPAGRNRIDHADDLIEIYGGSQITNLYIYGKFYPLDFTSLEITDSYFEDYEEFDKSRFPANQTVFYSCIFKGISPASTIDSTQKLFDKNCRLNDELRKAMDERKDSTDQLYSQVKDDLIKFLKKGFHAGGFSWKSDDMYKSIVTKPPIGREDFLEYLLDQKVFIEEPKRGAGQGVVYKVSPSYQVSAKRLITDNLSDSMIKKLISALLKEFFNKEK